jgi:hypothetical protein
MNKIFFSILICIFFGIVKIKAADPNFVETTIRYNAITERYEVYAKFDINGPTVLGMSMLTVMLPEECPDVMLNCQSYNGGIWVDNSRTFNENGYDYHGLITNGISHFGFLANKEQKIFDFQLPKGVSVSTSKVRLWNTKIDVKETKDGTDFRSNFYIAKAGYYLTPEVYESTTTGVKDDVSEFKIEVYPNPAIDMVKLTALADSFTESAATIQLINIEGKVLVNYVWDLSLQHTFDINVSHLPAATYQLIVNYDYKSHETTIVKLNK